MIRPTLSARMTDRVRVAIQPSRPLHSAAMTMPDETSDVDNQPAGVWLDLRAAQHRLGVSERTLHRRIATGKLRRRTRLDGRLEVWLPAAPGPTLSDEMTDSVSTTDHERQLVIVERFGETIRGLVEPLQRDLAEARGQVERLARENGELSERTRHMEARVAELEARLLASETSGAKSDTSDRASDTVSHLPEASSGSTARPWWRFW